MNRTNGKHSPKNQLGLDVIIPLLAARHTQVGEG
jgi:hypothetical protein